MDEWVLPVSGIVIVLALGWLRLGIQSLKRDLKRLKRAVETHTGAKDSEHR